MTKEPPPQATEQRVVRVASSIGEVAEEQWNACAGDDDPFISHAFLTALEESGSATAERGWLPQHLLVEDDKGRIVAAAPCYLKGHSYGEYVFDWSWANAFERAGGNYYPKLQCCVPFTPVTGPRLLVRPGSDTVAQQRLLCSALQTIARQHQLSSAHISFLSKTEQESAKSVGMLSRYGVQYHWPNHDYQCFDDFLKQLLARKRKAIRRERRRAEDCSAKLHVLTGDDIKPEHWKSFYSFYTDTVDRKWAKAYLTPQFFEIIGQSMADKVVLIMWRDNDQWVAGALNFLGKNALYGRYWGSRPGYSDLHFESCYHQAIEFAIEHKLKRVEAGAQGEHKVQRGYLPTRTFSSHFVAEPSFEQAIAEFLERESEAIGHDIDLMQKQHSPYRCDRS